MRRNKIHDHRRTAGPAAGRTADRGGGEGRAGSQPDGGRPPALRAEGPREGGARQARRPATRARREGGAMTRPADDQGRDPLALLLAELAGRAADPRVALWLVA